MSGSLLELVARGKKDDFFISNPSIAFFNSVYMKYTPFTKEIYISNPRNIPEWGQCVEFEIDHRGDIIKNFYLRIDLPSWLPSELININKTGIITDISGVSYGWCNNIGFHLINKIQILQDQVTIHEIYGEYLDWYYRQQYNIATYMILRENVGWRENDAISIGRSASIKQLRVPIPIIGSQHIGDPGLPLCALNGQRLRIRVYLRNLSELIVASDGRLKPSPWSLALNVQQTKMGPIDTSYKSLKKSDMRSFSMRLEQTVIYVRGDVQTWLKSQTIRILYKNIQHHEYTISDNQLTASSLNRGGTYQIPLPLDFIGPVSRMMLGFRSNASTEAGQRDKLVATNGASYIRSIRLNIANIDRIQTMGTAIFKSFTDYWKYAGNNDMEYYTLTFGGGPTHSIAPCGTLNLTRASEPNIFIILNNIPYDPRNISRTTYAILYVESWNVYEIFNNMGKLMFDEC